MSIRMESTTSSFGPMPEDRASLGCSGALRTLASQTKSTSVKSGSMVLRMASEISFPGNTFGVVGVNGTALGQMQLTTIDVDRGLSTVVRIEDGGIREPYATEQGVAFNDRAGNYYELIWTQPEETGGVWSTPGLLTYGRDSPVQREPDPGMDFNGDGAEDEFDGLELVFSEEKNNHPPSDDLPSPFGSYVMHELHPAGDFNGDSVDDLVAVFDVVRNDQLVRRNAAVVFGHDGLTNDQVTAAALSRPGSPSWTSPSDIDHVMLPRHQHIRPQRKNPRGVEPRRKHDPPDQCRRCIRLRVCLPRS